jgi:hypothetical protein
MIDKNPILAMIATTFVFAPMLPPMIGPFTNVVDHLAICITLAPPHLSTDVWSID